MTIPNLYETSTSKINRRGEPFSFAGVLNITIAAEDKQKWEQEEKRFEILEPTLSDLNFLLSGIESSSTVSLQTIVEFIDQLQEKKSTVKRKLFKNIDYQSEFGVSRLISDRVFILPKLLENLMLHEGDEMNSYKLSAQEKNSAVIVGLEYLFEASDSSEAYKVAEIFKQKITGVGEHLWLACWDFANEAVSWIFEVDTLDLYRKCHPFREAHPNGKERKEFFNLIRLLERTKFFLTRQKKGKSITAYELPVIQICSFDGPISQNGWPRRLKLQVIPPNALDDTMAFVAAPFNRNTLRLDHSEMQLATMIQVRRSQLKGSNSIDVSLKELIRSAGLQPTARTKLAQAKKLLATKLSKLKSMGIVKGYPFEFPQHLDEYVNITLPSRKQEG